MGETLEALHRLQEVELQLAEIRQGRESKQRRVESSNRKIKDSVGKLELCKHRQREKQIRMDALSLEVQVREESVNKHREALNTTKTNKEYSAILAAMNTEKADNAKLESQILEIMEELQSIEAEVKNIGEQQAELQQSIDSAEAALAKYDAKNKEQLDSLLAQREECGEGIAATTLASFARVAQHHDGEAMASVFKTNPKRDEYVCTGCHMKISLEVVNILLTRDTIQSCGYCGRILYIESTHAAS